MIKIEDKDIKDAERFLIDGEEFDEERREFIFCLDTIDLLAVPGSGKTTALLAKLYCLAKQMPFENNEGILVLSHTNNAVEEIEKVLKPICPQLFSYPNFVGTVQSFANKFIANQACFELYGSYIRKNDDEVADNELIYEFSKMGWDSKLRKYIFMKLYSQFTLINKEDLSSKTLLNSKEITKQLNLLKKKKFITSKNTIDYTEVKNIESDPIGIYLLELDKVAKRKINEEYKYFCLRYEIDFLGEKFIANSGNLKFDSLSGKELLGYFESSLKKGVLRYRDSISLAIYYLNKRKEIINVLQKRFKYVLIDEMQDLDHSQSDLIESIFFTKDSLTVIQRIGDKNQAIYTQKSDISDVVWKTRYEINSKKYPKNLSLKNSHRLTSKIACLVDGFVVNRDQNYQVKGVSKANEISPYLLVYNDESATDNLLKTYKDLIVKHNLHHDVKNVQKGFYIIGWTTSKEEGSDKWHLKKLFPRFSKEIKTKKEDFDCLRKYVFLFDREKKTLEAIRKTLLNGIIRILRIEQCYFDLEKKQHFRKSSFIQAVKEKGDDYYKDFNKKLYNWSFSIITKQNYEDVFIEYKKFIFYELMNIVSGFRIFKSNDFICKQYNYIYDQEKSVNVVSDNLIDINLSSIHGVKGQTHCATLYLETFYMGEETIKLNNKSVVSNPLYFMENQINSKNRVNLDKTLKMMYVGFSRPTHLLCFAVRRKNVQNDLDKYKVAGWSVIEI